MTRFSESQQQCRKERRVQHDRIQSMMFSTNHRIIIKISSFGIMILLAFTFNRNELNPNNKNNKMIVDSALQMNNNPLKTNNNDFLSLNRSDKVNHNQHIVDDSSQNTENDNRTVPMGQLMNRTFNNNSNSTVSVDNLMNQEQQNVGNQNKTKLVWLLSFPNSGTTYTLKLLQSSTNTTTGTNYGSKEQSHSIPSIPYYIPNGPYLRYPEWNVPNQYILVKTHCENRMKQQQHQNNRRSDKQWNRENFIRSCCTGNHRVDKNTTITTQYEPSIISKVIHLVRNPFNNIVARLHYLQRHVWQQQQQQNKNNTSPDDDNNNNENDTNGYYYLENKYFGYVPNKNNRTEQIKRFHQWCSYHDRIASEKKSYQYGSLRSILEELNPIHITKTADDDDVDDTNNFDEDNHTTYYLNVSQQREQYWLHQVRANGRLPYCLSEFYSYLKWHQLAVEMTTTSTTTPDLIIQQQPLINRTTAGAGITSTTTTRNDEENEEHFRIHPPPTLVLYYEDFDVPYQEEVHSSSMLHPQQRMDGGHHDHHHHPITNLSKSAYHLLTFLQFDLDHDLVGTIPTFDMKEKDYEKHYFDQYDRNVMKEVAQNYLSDRAWQLVQHYFSNND